MFINATHKKFNQILVEIIFKEMSDTIIYSYIYKFVCLLYSINSQADSKYEGLFPVRSILANSFFGDFDF